VTSAFGVGVGCDFVINAFGVGNCDEFQPPPSAVINWTLAVIRSIRKVNAVR
jgi:hypothetical protein